MECVLAQQRANLPLQARSAAPLPCPVHGDPRWLWPENAQAYHIFAQMAGNFLFHTFQEGETSRVKPFLNVLVVKVFAEAYQVDFLELLDRLRIILRESYE